MIAELKVAIEMASPGTPSLTALRIAEVVAERIREAKAEAWDEGHAASERDWQFTFDLSTPDEDRQPLTNPYREA